MKPSFVKFIPAIFWFLLITILLCLPGKDIPKVDFLDYINFDKFVHAGLFCGLVFFTFLPFNLLDLSFTKKRKIIVKIAIAATLYGIAMEFVQKYFIPGRSFDITDMIADGVGAFLPYWFQKTMDKTLNLLKKKQVV